MKIVSRNAFYNTVLVTPREAADLLGVDITVVNRLIADKRVLPADEAKHARERWALHEIQSALLAMHCAAVEDSKRPVTLATKDAWVAFLSSILTRYCNASPKVAARALYEEVSAASLQVLRESGVVKLFGMGSLSVARRARRNRYNPALRKTTLDSGGRTVKYTRSKALKTLDSKESTNEG